MTARPAHRRDPPRRLRRHAGGVSLIEVLVSLLIFSVGLLGLLSLQTRATRATVSAEDTTRASLLASELASQMWAKRTVALSNAEIDAWKTRVADVANGGLPNTTAAVNINGNVAEIRIAWRPPGVATTAAAQSNVYTTQVVVQGP